MIPFSTQGRLEHPSTSFIPAENYYFYPNISLDRPYSEAEMQAFAESPKGQVLRKMEMLPRVYNST
jgi:hypothetical protein